jgi:hypothetical protein
LSLVTSDVIENFLNLTSAFLLGLLLFLVDVAGASDRFASALLGTLFGLAFHPIKNRMEHALRRFDPEHVTSVRSSVA